MIRAILESMKADNIAALAPSEKADGNSPHGSTNATRSTAPGVVPSTAPQTKGLNTNTATRSEPATTDGPRLRPSNKPDLT